MRQTFGLLSMTFRDLYAPCIRILLYRTKPNLSDSSICQYLPDATMSDARGGQTGQKVLQENLFKPIFPTSGDQVYS